ncbi:MAG: hypothetical protein LBC12_04405 [Nitrososphaerota archaeon]|jgi:hypothetical protein|nr:hypothetical protein [Nitrososphaerota archaeon]
MVKHVLLVKPKGKTYYSAYPPLGLLKLSTYEKKQGNTTELVYGTGQTIQTKPDTIYISSLFTWGWEPVWEAVRYYASKFPNAELWLGGLYASLMPEHAALSGVKPDHIFKGIHPKAELELPDYELVPQWNKKEKASIVFASRGCIRSCVFCGVPQIEGKLCLQRNSIREQIWPGHKRLIFFDNNLLATKNVDSIFNQIADIGFPVDFNQGLDARLINEKIAEKIAEIKIDRFVRLAFDTSDVAHSVENAIQLLKAQGIDGRNILVYLLYNFTDTPQDFFDRLKKVLKLGAVAYPMRFQPVHTLKKNSYISPLWSKERLNSVDTARRLWGSGGTFPPYAGLMKVKVEGCQTFDEAFTNGIYEKNGGL